MPESSPLLRPTPRRPFECMPASTPADSSAPATPPRAPSDFPPGELESSESKAAHSTGSVLNLTASTLFGIYSPSGYESVREGASTPWGTGASTPSRQPTVDEGRPLGPFVPPTFSRRPLSSLRPRTRFDVRNNLLPLTLRAGLLFGFGIAYGLIIAHLHDNQQLAPVKVENIDRSSWGYLISWGVAGVLLGGLLPWVDIFWEEALGTAEMVPASTPTEDTRISPHPGGSRDASPADDAETWLGADWNPVVRSIGAFIGIAFAIVKCAPSFHMMMANRNEAQTSLAVNCAGLPYPRHGQSIFVVSDRPLKTRVPPLRIHRYHRHNGAAEDQSRHGAVAPGALSPC
jgi:hypothetical protein